MRRIESDRDHWNNISTQLMVKAAGLLLLLFGFAMRKGLRHGGAYMEVFLRYDFGVRYFPVSFSLFTAVGLMGGFLYSGAELFLTPLINPMGIFSALSLFTGWR